MGRRIATRTCDLPPDCWSKKSTCLAVGLPRRSVKATIRPVRGATNGLRRPPSASWKPVVRVIARHGLVGQLGVPIELSVLRPSSETRADAPEGASRRRAAAQTAAASSDSLRAVIETIEPEAPVGVAARHPLFETPDS